MAPERASVSASTPGSIFEDMLIMGSSVPERTAKPAKMTRGTVITRGDSTASSRRWWSGV